MRRFVTDTKEFRVTVNTSLRLKKYQLSKGATYEKTTRRWSFHIIYAINYSVFALGPSILIDPAPDEARINNPPVTAIFLKKSN